jgi:hypothetical protein
MKFLGAAGGARTGDPVGEHGNRSTSDPAEKMPGAAWSAGGDIRKS